MRKFAKIKYNLTITHKLVAAFLLFMGIISFFINKSGYSEGCYHETINYFNLIHAGDYQITVKYSELPQDSELIVYTKDKADAYNDPQMEIARMGLRAGAAEVELQVHVEDELNRLYVSTNADTEEHSFIDEAYIDGLQLLDYDNYYVAVILVLSALLVLALGWYVDCKRYYRPAVLVAIALIASIPLFSDFLICVQDYDISFHFARINGIYAGLRAGEFPVRINSVQTEGLGNMSATMYPGFFLYPIAFFHMLGMSTILGYKLLLVSANIGTAIFSFYSVSHICKSEKIGWLATIFYTFSSYRLNDMYVRGALGETLAMTFFPLVFWGAYEILFGDRKKWYVLTLGMTGVLESHVLSVEMCVFFLVLQGIVFLFSSKPMDKGYRILCVVKAAFATSLLNAAFLIPFLYYAGEDFIVFSERNNARNSTVYFSQMFTMFSEPSGINNHRGYTLGEMPLTIGAPLILGAVSLIIMRTLKKEDERDGKYSVATWYFICGSIALFMASWFFPWELFVNQDILERLASSIQFPWRMLAPASIFFSIAAAAGIEFMAKQEKYQWISRAILVLEFISLCYFIDRLAFDADALNKKQAETSKIFDYLYMYDGNTDLQNTTIVYNTAGMQVDYTNYNKSGSRVSFDMISYEDVGEEDYLVFPLYYYPGYEVLIDGQTTEILRINNRVACRLPQDAAHIEAYFKGSPIFRAADAISLFAMMVMCVYLYYSICHMREKTVTSKGKNVS